jgi:hypothetical protein
MTGLEQAQEYYEKCGRETLARQFPECWERVAAGLVGEGSECFGYDDAISQNHDCGGGFCLWLSPGDYEKYGKAMEAAYIALPQMVGDIKKGDIVPWGAIAWGYGLFPPFIGAVLGIQGTPLIIEHGWPPRIIGWPPPPTGFCGSIRKENSQESGRPYLKDIPRMCDFESCKSGKMGGVQT